MIELDSETKDKSLILQLFWDYTFIFLNLQSYYSQLFHVPVQLMIDVFQ